jgi:hypothetical protein
MILSFAMVFAAMAVLLLLFYVEGGGQAPVSRLEDIAGRIQPVDIDAFRNLVDPGEEAFLRAHLRPREFREIQRERLRAAMDYIRSSSHNAAFLLRLGEAAVRSSDPRVAAAGRKLVESALRLRASALLSVTLLYVRMALPGVRLSYGELADKYQHLSGLASQLAMMQHPAQAARFSAML